MFTGIIESVGEVVGVGDEPGARSLAIAAPWSGGLVLGESVSVDGACLTVDALGDDAFSVLAGSATLERTIAGGYRRGSPVNLERAARLGDRLGGHFVQGHVDGVAVLEDIRETGATRLLSFKLPAEVWAVTALHGSIALNGVSLTVNRLGPARICEVALIPHTWEHTNLRHLRVASAANVEADLIGRYVQRLMRGDARGSA
ncbi:MAG: riboflavin synthase [Gemmatimonadetes bacterium]|nr:riboflavin synthase [Gemmatimonadota bacterium]